MTQEQTNITIWRDGSEMRTVIDVLIDMKYVSNWGSESLPLRPGKYSYPLIQYWTRNLASRVSTICFHLSSCLDHQPLRVHRCTGLCLASFWPAHAGLDTHVCARADNSPRNCLVVGHIVPVVSGVMTAREIHGHGHSATR